MNAQNPSEVSTRVSYYGVSGVPHINYDGKTIGTGSSPNSPSHLTQTKINDAYALPSPFSIDLTHTVNSNYDSITITAIITAEEIVNITSGTNPLRLQIALVEKQIDFDNPPGTNGEKIFYNVMRKMIPNASGMPLSSSWTNGQDQTITIKVRIPSYIYDLNQLRVIAFIQDNNDKDIKQAAITNPIPVADDAGVSAISGIPILQCNTSISPSVTVKNFGANTLTSAVINYRVNNGAVMTQNWTGSLASGDSVIATLPAITVTNGSHTFTSFITLPNGVADVNSGNDSKTSAFNISLLGTNQPIEQSFQTATFPPADYLINNPDNGPTWTRVTNAGGFGNSTASARMFLYASPSGQIDELFLP
jgi:hypothetical protein